MKEQVFPPSPNWYLGSGFSCKSNGLLAYGSRNCLVVIDTNTGVCLPKVEIVSNAHHERVSSVVLSSFQDKSSVFYNCVATAGDDGLVKVWDLKTLTPVIAHGSHSRDSKVCGMDWSRANPNVIISIDDANNLVSWDLPSNSTHSLNVGKLGATILSCCPINKYLVAVGCKSGLVCVINIKGHGKVLYRMRGHDTEVVSLAWCPISSNVIQQNIKYPEQKEFLLASAAKERSIFIWRAGTDGRYESVISIPPHLLTDKRINKNAVMEVNWISLCWPKPGTLLFSTRTGRVLSWDLQLMKGPKAAALGASGDGQHRQLWKTVHTIHNRMVFNLVCPNINYEAEADSKDEPKEENLKTKHAFDNRLLIWSTSQDRQIVCYDVDADQGFLTIPTIGGIVSCIAASPIDPNRIAFGAADSAVRVWNLSSPFPYDVTVLWQKVRGKVSAIAWHPVQENKLALGTAEGRVGVFDMLNPNKPPILLRPYHTKCLYTVGWGPALLDGAGEHNPEYVLYSCGEGAIVQYNIHVPENEARNINELTELQTSSKKGMIRTDFAWSPNNAIFAIGNEDGTVQVVSFPKITLLSTILAQKTLIQSLAWHPEGTATDTAYSPCQNWLAVAGKRTPIKVFNVTPLLEGDPSSQAECIVAFSLHKSCIVDLCWSPHISGQLVSASFDGTVQVWDVIRQQPVGNFSNHVGPVHSCCWSPLDPDSVITGGADATLRVWNISALEDIVPTEKKKERMKKLRADALLMSVSAKGEPLHDEDEKMPVAGLSTREYDLHPPKRRSARSYFPFWAKIWQGSHTNMLERCEKFTKEGYPPDTEPTLLGSRSNVLQLLKEEETVHTQNSNFEHVQHFSLWRGDLVNTLRKAAEKKHLSEWLVSLAPMISQRLWMEMCKAYAEQLSLEGHFLKAVSYLLACHEVEEALELLLQNNLFREAVAVARLRLSEDDPTANNILRTWAHRQIEDGHFERSAECLLSIGEYSEAAEVLGRRNDGKCILVAALLARKGGSLVKALSLAKNGLIQALLQKQWDVADNVVSEFPELQPLTLVICTHKTIMSLLLEKIEVKGPLLDWIHGTYSSKYGRSPQEHYKALDQSLEKKLVPETKTKLWLAVSESIALSVSAPDEHLKLWHLVQTAHICYQFQLVHPGIFPLLQLLMWLAPEGVLEKRSIFVKEPEEEKAALLAKSLKLYLYTGFFSWLASVEAASGFGNKRGLTNLQAEEDNNSEKTAGPKNGEKTKAKIVLENPEESKTVSKEKSENSACVDALCEGKDENECTSDHLKEQGKIVDSKTFSEIETENSVCVGELSEVKNENDSASHLVKEQLKTVDSKTVSMEEPGNSGCVGNLNYVKDEYEDASGHVKEQINSVDSKISACVDESNEAKDGNKDASHHVKEQINTVDSKTFCGEKPENSECVDKLNQAKDRNETVPDHAKEQVKAIDLKRDSYSSQKIKPTLDEQMNDSEFRFNEVIFPLLSSFSNELDHFAPFVEYFKVQIELKKYEKELASRIAHTHQNSAEKSQYEQPGDQQEEEEQQTSTLKGLQKLDELKEKKEEFEKLRGSTPSPFITYCNFRSVCDFFAGEERSENLKEIADTAARKWLSMMGSL